MNTKLTTEAKTDYEKDFFKLMSNAVFGKTKEECKKAQKSQTFDDRKKKKLFTVRNKLLHHNKTVFKNLLPIKMNKTKVKMNKPVYASQSIIIRPQ